MNMEPRNRVVVTLQTLISHWQRTIIAGALLLVPHTSACATTESNTPTQDTGGQLIQQLRATKALDLSDAHDLSVGPVAAGDFMVRADRAEEVIGELERGVRVFW